VEKMYEEHKDLRAVFNPHGIKRDTVLPANVLMKEEVMTADQKTLCKQKGIKQYQSIVGSIQ
jgi:hypothetical protein